MADRFLPRVWGFTGGFATDLPSQARDLTYWLKCENILFEVSGAVRKAGGATKVNAIPADGDADIAGMFDFWRGGGAASFTQKFVVVAGNSKIYRDDMDGTLDDITGGASITANMIPVFCQARDLLTIWSSANDLPLKYNQTGDVGSLGGTPPVGRGMVFHANRGWAWGVNANASRLYYSSSTDIEDWSGADTGSLDLDPEDGDRITGAISYKHVLIVFKGPQKGSLHQIAGTAPTGADAFSRKVLVRGIPLQTHNSIVPVGDDALFMSDRGIHSLGTTIEFGNFREKDLTRFLRGYFRESVNMTHLQKVWGTDYSEKSCVVWVLPAAGSAEPNRLFGLSYIQLAEKGWQPFTWTRGGISACTRIHPTTRRRNLVFGTTDGFVALQDTADRSIYSNTAYAARMLSPEVLIGEADGGGRPRGDIPVTLERMYLRSKSSGDHDVNVTVKRDNGVEPYTFNQGSSGFLLGTSILGVHKLGGTKTRIVYSKPPVIGTTRGVQFDITQGGLNQDMNLLEIGLEYTSSGQSDADTA